MNIVIIFVSNDKYESKYEKICQIVTSMYCIRMLRTNFVFGEVESG